MNVTVARYALGVAALLAVCASLGLAAVSLRRRYFGMWTGAVARLAEFVIGLALLIWILEALGTVGLFRLGPIVGACVVVGLGAAYAVRGAGAAARRVALVGGTGSGAPQTVFALLISAAVVAEWASPTLQSYDIGIHTFDSLWYHLPWAASFAQTGHITPLRFTDVEYLTAFYPASAELLHGLGITVLARDTLSPAINLMWLCLVLLAGWCVGRPRGVGALTLAGAALALATPMMSFSQAGSAANDVVGVFFLLAAVALLINAEGSGAAYALAAVAAGLAVAVKLSLVASVLALTIGVIAIAPRVGRRAIGGRWLGWLALGGGFWYLRNLIAVGNPLPWISSGVLPTPTAPLQQHTGFSVVHYLTDTRAWSAFFEPGLAAGLGRWWYLIVAAVVVGPLLCLLPGSDRMVRMLGLVALGSLAAYLLTPETAAGPAGDPAGFAFNLRYAAPALTLSLAILPLAPVFAGARAPLAASVFVGARASSAPRRSALPAAGLAVALVAVLVATVWQAPLWPTAHFAGALLLGFIVLVMALARRYLPRAVLAAAAVALVAAVAAAGYPWQRHYLRGRYAFKPGVSYLARTWAYFRNVHHTRVGLAGTLGGFFSYPLFGADDSNTVRYVGRRGPHGSFTAIRSCPQWRAAVNASRFRYLVSTPARDPWHPKELSRSPEAAWTGSDAAARVVLTKRAAGQQITVYELRGLLDPSRCG